VRHLADNGIVPRDFGKRRVKGICTVMMLFLQDRRSISFLIEEIQCAEHA
jgi:hypothetical protein